MNDDFLIEIVVDHFGHRSTAYANDPEGALLAARTLCDEAFEQWNVMGARPVAYFLDADGKLIRGPIKRKDLG